MRALALRALIALFALSTASLAACDEDEFFHTCPLSQTIIEICEAESTTTSLTCVVAEHPLCEEQVCAKWQDSESFCTRVCSTAGDCPDGSTCESYLDFAFCVPLTFSAPTVAP